MLVNIDVVAIGATIRIGVELYRKVSPMILTNVRNGELLYDARIMGWPKAEAPMVEYIGR